MKHVFARASGANAMSTNRNLVLYLDRDLVEKPKELDLGSAGLILQLIG
jgi:hypothetical protein